MVYYCGCHQGEVNFSCSLHSFHMPTFDELDTMILVQHNYLKEITYKKAFKSAQDLELVP